MIRYRMARLILFIFILPFMAGCTAHSFREAQDQFNMGAELETASLTRSLTSEKPNAHPGDAAAALNEYRLAYNISTKLIDSKSSELQKDNLLGAAYLLKAMAIWRISDLEGDQLIAGEQKGATKPSGNVANNRQQLLAVLDQINDLQSRNSITLGTRDKVLFKALYGFYDHDGGRAANDYATAEAWFKSAYQRMGESLTDDVPQEHPVRIYIGSAQLRTLAAWNLAAYNGRKKCNQTVDPATCRKPIETAQGEIKSDTQAVICDHLRPFWEYNEEIKDNLTLLLVTIGLPSMFSQCK